MVGDLGRKLEQAVAALDADCRPLVDRAAVALAVHDLLRAIGEDPEREGLRDTPKRVAKWWAEFVDYEPGTLETSFETVQTDQLVCVTGMRVWSLCEHHLLPFWNDVAVAYIPRDRVLGLSKFGRIARKHAHRLQLQERLIQGIADEVLALTGSPDVAVLGTGEHLCMSARGVQMPALMSSSVLRGRFKEQEAARAEFFALARPTARVA